MMAFCLQRDQWLDARRRTALDILLARLATVGEGAPCPPQLLPQRLELLDHERQLLLVVRRLHDLGGHYHQVACGPTAWALWH